MPSIKCEVPKVRLQSDQMWTDRVRSSLESKIEVRRDVRSSKFKNHDKFD